MVGFAANGSSVGGVSDADSRPGPIAHLNRGLAMCGQSDNIPCDGMGQTGF